MKSITMKACGNGGGMLVGGSAVPRSMIVAYGNEYDVKIVHAWGMTEMSPL